MKRDLLFVTKNQNSLAKMFNLLKFAFKNSGSLFLAKTVGIGINYLALLLVLYYFGFAENGELANFVAQAKGIMIILVFGLDIVLVKRLNALKRDINSILLTGKTLLFNILISFILIAIINSFYPLSYSFFIGGALLSIWRYIGHFYRGMNNMIIYGFFEFILFQSTILIAVFICEYYPYKLVETIIGINILIFVLIGITLGFKYFPKIMEHKIFRFRYRSILNLYKESFHFVISGSIVILSTSLTYILIKYYYDASILGIYDTVLKFSQIVLLPLIATSGRVMALTAKYFNSNNLNDLKKYISKTTQMLAVTSSICAIIVIGFFYFYSTYFNSVLISYWTLFLLMIFAQLINNWAGPVGVVLQLTNNEKIFNLITFLSSLYLVISTIIVSMFFDIEYIALNYVIYMVFQNYFSLLIMKKQLNINVYKI